MVPTAAPPRPSVLPPSIFPKPVGDVLARARAWLVALPKPARVLGLSTLSLAVLFAGYFLYRSANEPYTTLFNQLDRDDAAAIVAKLKELKVPYRVEADGASVSVPEAKVRELRLELASSGLPRGGGVGFESFDKMRLGATEFEQRVLYRRALEGELSRTIGTLGAVESARVHLVMPEKSVFVARSEPASASIVLRLHLGRTLGSSEVSGIVHLAASAVPGLGPDHITVVTTDGAMLHHPRSGPAGAEGGDGDDDEQPGAQARQLESTLEDRVRAMLEKVVGPGHAEVKVKADLDPARVERTEDHYDPARSALRSEEESIERDSPDDEGTAAGVPGAESNLPTGNGKPTPPPKPVASASAPTRQSHTRNFEIDHISEKRVVLAGALKRLTVAVVVDGVPRTEDGHTFVVPRSREELDKLTMLVRSAAGASDTRADMVTVESIPFVDVEAPAPAAAPPPATTPVAVTVRKYARYEAAAGGVLILAIAVWAVTRRRKRADQAQKVAQLSAPAQAPRLEAAEAANHVDLRAEAHARAASDPATAALVLRFWLGTAHAEDKGKAAA